MSLNWHIFWLAHRSGRDIMIVLVAGLVAFFLVHAIPMQTGLRARLTASLGAGAYKGLFSVVAGIGLVLIIVGYGQLQTNPDQNPELWQPPFWLRHVTHALMLPALVLLVAAYVPSRIRDVTRHPMLAAIKLWALAHLIANGDLASVVLFGSFLAYAVVDRISVKRRAARGPIGDRLGTPAGDAIAVAGGLAAYAILVAFAHQWLFGVAPIPSLAL